ncbi:RES family NAD+ phosphorylase [Dickeya fangzhongdai]|uniref:RES family NAD+ phosphorylase n=1 Tax=Dickeya fangzhongdai TaxID=1778540 RepID=UPI002B25FD29|nr:RES family NAD+ phosphorylase [Dickeya fangzhongdai]WOY03134.1 RES family NAD+ phosphorylase [Dickeya fangzhongdai]
MVNRFINNMFAEMREEEIKSSRGYICAECNHSAYYFCKKNSQLNSGKQCLMCSEIRPDGILVEDFEFTLRRNLRDHYTLEDSRSTDTIPLKDVLKRFTYDNEDFLAQLASLLCQPDDTFFREDGWYRNIVDEAFIATCRDDAIREWEDMAYELKHVRRFSHSGASRYYADLIGSCFHTVEKEQEKFNTALTILPKGEALYRGRIAKDNEEKEAFLSDPVKKLSAPPNHLATNSRMSPPGIAFLYTASDAETAIAELHPFISDTVAIGQFVTVRDLRFFDFTLLDNVAYADAHILDNPIMHKTFRNRYLMSTLHHLIARPLRANDTSYIETQVFAEIIRGYQGEKYDGIIFGSTQRPGGRNYVIFGESTATDGPTGKRNEHHVEFNHEQGVTLYRITEMRAQAEVVPHSYPVIS